MNVWIITPTYNERLNLAAHLDRILTALPSAHVLVVDDASPDGTGQVADERAAADSRVSVLHRAGKLGLGTAYAEGCGLAIAQGAEVVAQLDADGSHPPDLLPAMIGATHQTDLVLASRYVHGGSMHIDPWRRFVSALGNTYIRWLLGRRIHDWSTGFKVWRSATLRQVLAVPPRARGYAWLMETSWLALRSGATVTELPLVFAARQAGESKFSAAIAWEDLRVAWRLRRGTLAVEPKK
jgi:dolichol-phosphate mannosyltransferase